jgi:D-aminopeptidase
MQVEHEDVVAAYDAALASRGSPTPPDEGAVGSGTGMSCLGFKGGIGTSSRVVGEHTVAVLLMTNFGVREELVVNGVPSAQPRPRAGARPRHTRGVLHRLVVTDARSTVPLRALARGRARPGPRRSVAHHGRREIFLASATGMRMDRDGSRTGPGATGAPWTRFVRGVVEASRSRAELDVHRAHVTGRDGNTSEHAHTRPSRTSVDEGAGGPIPYATAWLPARSTSPTSAGRSRAWWRRCPTARTT